MKAAEKLDAPEIVAREEVLANTDYVGEGCGVPTRAGLEAIRMFAQLECFLLDPVYSCKGAAGVLDLILKGHFENDAHIIYLHTGGAAALFGNDAALSTA